MMRWLRAKHDNPSPRGLVSDLWLEPRARRALKEAESQHQWEAVIRNGLKILAENPWHVATLKSMATAEKHMGHTAAQLQLLSWALESDSFDRDTNVQCARALTEVGEYDSAIACWERVERVHPGDEEAQREIAALIERRTNETVHGPTPPTRRVAFGEQPAADESP